jgi:hypothetical protein
MKSIQITGTNNRYQMKKVTRENEMYKYRSRVATLAWETDLYTIETQMKILMGLHQTIAENGGRVIDISFHEPDERLMKKELDHKLSGYVGQDRLKKREGRNISFAETVEKLLTSRLICYYCNTQCHIFYERVREMSQWSFDRIDNDLCHSVDNVVVSCLKCNLARKTRSSKKFKDTKDMKDVVLMKGEEEADLEECVEECSDISSEEENTKITVLPRTATRVSKRLVEKLANNVVMDDCVVVPIQEEIH